MKTAFAFEKITAGYRGVPVLNELSFSVQEGEMLALIGPNGAGKSTFLRVLSGLLPPHAGRVFLLGRDARALRALERSRLLAVVPQELSIAVTYSVEELVMMGRSALLSPWERPSDADWQVVERALVYADLSDLRGRSLDALSGGEKQRAVLAMALAQEPRIIVMDEPTTHLDLNHALELMQLIERLNRESGVTVLMTSHDLNLAAEFCRRLALMDHGRIVADGSGEDVLREDVLREVYNCEVRVRRDEGAAAPLVLPARRMVAPLVARGMRVHVIAGGGCGAEALRGLALAGFRVSCGVLNERDSDAQTAAALGLDVALEKPFSPIGGAALEQAAGMADQAQAVIVCEVPFGAGNVGNLDLAERRLRDGAPVFIHDRGLETRDYTGDGRAVSCIRRMLAGGARPWRIVNQLLAELSACSR